MFAGQAFAQITQNNEPISETQAMLQETVQQTESTESTENEYGYETSPQQRFEENPKHNVHEYDYKQQVVVGGTVMFCVVLAMVLNNNYNPKRGK
jgi:hypothetical protein